jgi:hypothetical protein
MLGAFIMEIIRNTIVCLNYLACRGQTDEAIT